MEKIIILVTACGTAKSACNYKLASKDPGFLNIGTSLAIEEIKKKYSYEIVLAVKKINKKIYKLNSFNNIKVIEIGKTKNIIDTIQESLKQTESEWCLINPITSIPDSKKITSSFIEFGSKMIPKENWSSISFNNQGLPLFHSKLDKKSLGLKSFPFTGRIFAKTKDINNVINSLVSYQKKDLLYLAENLFLNKQVKLKYSNWLDIGHVATYPITRISTIKSRFFNSLIYDEKKNLIRKISNNKSKIDNEIKYYSVLPEEIKRYFPKIFFVEKDKFSSSYYMEYICKPTLAEIYLFSQIGPNAILRIINSIDRIFKNFYSQKVILEEDAKSLYSGKTKSRQKEFEKIIQENNFEFLKKIYYQDYSLNNCNFPALKKTFTFLIKELKKFEQKRPLKFGHGDLCFNNILVDPIFGELNLIDPKADKNKKHNLYGLTDSFYDLSKLNHSIEGLYDSIVNNLFNLDISDSNNINLEIYKPPEYEIFNAYFREIIIEKKISKKTLGILTGNLFLSMLPLHLDNKKRIFVLGLMGGIFINDFPIKKVFL